MTADTGDALSTLAASDSWYRTTVERAVAATGDLETAAAFAEAGGVERLRRAVAAAERSGDDGLARLGRRALSSFDRFRRVARGRVSTRGGRSDDQFHPAHGTPLTRDGQSSGR